MTQVLKRLLVQINEDSFKESYDEEENSLLNEDSFKESYDEEDNSLLELIMQMNNKEWQNTNCNNNGKSQIALDDANGLQKRNSNNNSKVNVNLR